jgi:hypothetical protein
MARAPDSPPASAFATVLKGLLRPLVKAMIAHGLTAPAVYRTLKEVFVEVAESDFAIEGRPATDSRISMLTGVHRKDVRAIREAAEGDGARQRRQVTAMASVVGRWMADPETTDAAGAPLPLPRQTEEGPSFEALARSVSTDIRPRTVLDELVRQGLVREDAATGRLVLAAEAFVGPAETGQKVHFFAQNVGDHIAAATENLLSGEGDPPFMERAVFYNRLAPASVDAIEAEAREEGAALLGRLNRLAFERQSADRDAPGTAERFRFGLFFYRAPETAGGSRADAAGEGDGDATD